MTLGAASLGFSPATAALWIEQCQIEDRRRGRRVRLSIGGVDYGYRVSGYRIELDGPFGPLPKARDWWGR